MDQVYHSWEHNQMTLNFNKEMFMPIAALFARPRKWNQSRCPSTAKWIMESFWDVKEIKTAIVFYVIWVKTDTIKEKKVNDAENECKKKTGIHYSENVNCCVHCVSVWRFLKMLKMKLPNQPAIHLWVIHLSIKSKYYLHATFTSILFSITIK